MTREDMAALVAEAALAPSVHNVQPARWRIDDDGATLFEDLSRRLPAADPTGHDAAMSLGAAAEGFCLAASRATRGVRVERLQGGGETGLRRTAHFALSGPVEPDPLAEWVDRRSSFRGGFEKASPADRDAATALVGDDAAILADPATLRAVDRHLDEASWRFMREDPFRRELLSWMRLSRGHPDWARDGLNADAMAMGPIAARGAGLVLGPMFGWLARAGLAKPLVSEGGRIAKDAAVVLFHRPVGEDPFDSGRKFYRLWLRIEAAGFGAAVLAALADDPEANAWAKDVARIPQDRRLVSAFRLGRRPAGPITARARLPIDEVLIG